MSSGPGPHPPDFCRRAVEPPRRGEQPIARIAEDLGMSESCLRGWMKQADIDEGRRDGLSGDERNELTGLRREPRVTRMENEILTRAAAYFARENVLPR